MANLGLYSGGLTLKALLENPDLQSAPIPNTNKVEKEKKENELHQIDASTAFLGPNLWDKTYDNTDINLEYMDLDEFLSENGIPVNLDALGNDVNGLQSPSPSRSNSSDSESIPIVNSVNVSPCHQPMMPPTPPAPRSSPPHSPQQHPVVSPVSPIPERISNVPSPGTSSPAKCDDEIKIDFSLSPTDMELLCIPATNSTVIQSPPQSPQSVDFSVSSDDLALVNITGEENFDPRKRTFSEEELKPQPMIKKSKKIFIHDEAKDDKYWSRRKKNNVAAKRSRDARRIKENQIAMRAAFLEKENNVLKAEMEKMKKENQRLKTSLSKYEPSSSSS